MKLSIKEKPAKNLLASYFPELYRDADGKLVCKLYRSFSAIAFLDYGYLKTDSVSHSCQQDMRNKLPDGSCCGYSVSEP